MDSLNSWSSSKCAVSTWTTFATYFSLPPFFIGEKNDNRIHNMVSNVPFEFNRHLVQLFRLLERCTRSDGSRIASYLTIITSREEARGNCGRSAKFQSGCLAFCQCLRGSDEHDRRKFNREKQKKDIKFLLI